MSETLRRRGKVTVHILGAAIMGLLAALELARFVRRRRLPVEVVVYEADAIGGGKQASTPRCQAWLHRQGVIWAQTQPQVSLKLQQSVPRLVELVPGAIKSPLALAIEPPSSSTAAESFAALSIAAQPISETLRTQWLPEVRLPTGCRAFRTLDGVLDLNVAVRELHRLCCRAGVEFRPGVATRLLTHGDRVSTVQLDRGETVRLRRDDLLVMTCGTGIRPVLHRSGLVLPGLRHFDCAMAAYPAGVSALLAVLLGGPNIVPHTMPDGSSMNVFANSRRDEVPSEADDAPLRVTPEALLNLRRDVAEWFGLELPTDALAWVGRKAEIVPDAAHRSQAQHVLTVGGLTNGWVALPGKLSQAAGTAGELVARLSDRLSSLSAEEPIIPVTRSIWERPAQSLEAHEVTTLQSAMAAGS